MPRLVADNTAGNGGRSSSLLAVLQPIPGKWLLCLLIAILIAALSGWPHSLPALRYERATLLDGDIWRALTGHFVHVGSAHVLLNIAGLVLVCELSWHEMPCAHGAALLLTSALAVSALLVWRHPELAWYAGLSGALHGLWAGCALAGSLAMTPLRAAALPGPGFSAEAAPRSRSTGRSLCLAGLVFLALKLLLESLYGAPSATEQLLGAPVVTVSHAYGALGGLLYVLLWRTVSWAKR